MPQQICEECVRRITTTFYFRQDCHSSQDMLEQFFRNDTKIVIDPTNSFEFLNLDHSVKSDERFNNQTAIQDIESIIELPKLELTTEILQANDNKSNISCLELQTVNDDSNFEFNVYENEVSSSNDVTCDEDNGNNDIGEGNANDATLECDQCGKHYKREVTIRNKEVKSQFKYIFGLAGSPITSSCEALKCHRHKQ